jgi:hypothetical protein
MAKIYFHFPVYVVFKHNIKEFDRFFFANFTKNGHVFLIVAISCYARLILSEVEKSELKNIYFAHIITKPANMTVNNKEGFVNYEMF